MTRRWALALVVAVSLLTHLKGLTAPPLDYHHHRQANTAAIARNFAENGLRFFHPQIDWAGPYRGRTATELPLYMWLTGALWQVLGLGAAWGRILSVLFSACSAALLFLLLERRLSRPEAFWGATLFSFIPLQIYFGRTIQPEALALAGTMGAFYAWDRWLDEGRPAWWLAAVACAFLAIGHKLPYAYSLLVLAGMAWQKRGWKVFKEPAVLAAAPLCAAAVYAWYSYASTGPYVVPSHPDEFKKILLSDRWLFYIQFQFVSRLPELAATWAGMALAVPGAWLLWKRGARFFHWWWTSVALHLIAGGAYTFAHEYTSLPFAPVMASFMGVGLVGGWSRAARKPLARAGLVLLVLAMPAMAAFRIKHWYGQNFKFLAKAEAAASSVSGRDDLFVCNQRAASVYLFEMKRRGWSFDFNEAGDATAGNLQALREQGAKFVATAAENLSLAHRGWLDAHYERVYDDGAFLIYRIR